ncbi:MAG: RpiB/LacA/LacB family sugar-phosphate isomerase [Myxococcota bacterium]|nr:RpiB/LacA/LacB family sugar-phosphate isomerase [Myxococcota bacterium]
MIRRLGAYTGKRIIFGYDRYLLPDLAAYRGALSAHGGSLLEAVDTGHLHYLSSAELTCRTVQADAESFGILCCGTGMGMSIAANKFQHIYAARCTTVEDAQLARSINNANVLCLASKYGFDLNRAIVDAFVTTPYTGRKLDELEYITSFERAVPSPSIATTLRRIA